MIKNQWYIVLSSKEVKKGELIGVTRFGEKLALWRDEAGKVHCISDVCCHRGASISHGKILSNGERVMCPFHGFEYDSTGRVCVIPANGRNTPVNENFKVKAYHTYELADFIWIWYGDGEPTNPPTYFEDITDDLSYSEFKEVWNVHYSRAIENQLDVVHVPFVHYNTIGRGNRTVVDGPIVKWFGDTMFYFYVFNRVDDGRPARKPEEIGLNEKSQVYLEFKFPNMWQNHIDEKIRVTAAFVPIDDEHTMIYLRFYIGFTKIRFLDKLITLMGMPFNRKILHQDKRVVETQIPKKSELRMGENLIPGDAPILEYRKKREALKNS
ncbi:aromatic ring-hydroxylating oxygenase subunit alpha [Fervidobacterium nodosum]|uniref:Rieske (2Fe-2S) domain protein n=1 Tax=Fervidobacterium nodosum (strain ATCC 35602 / DSM 5306 / Rt17-B1) TaxID=381764 RepID=A7HKH7_FERNB|nr:aromatic ring-hydroxylating dioxygenase subunit alpha [Fervidobacterium nodosum]ABS60410.1 Rieske (2Fe-2S) domain protein [Fervidobacterium nodosum Rt17-B1]PHJ14474.1 oxidase [Fervidobacterium sp. SC_NGM5_G05]